MKPHELCVPAEFSTNTNDILHLQVVEMLDFKLN